MADQDENSLRETLKQYWRMYGGTRGIVRSPYFWVSVVLLVLTSHFWLTGQWWEQVISVMPNVLGFTLGGFAIFLGFGDENFKQIISGLDENDVEPGPSPYMEVSATFLHFVLVQLGAILTAIVVKATSFTPSGWLASIATYIAPARFIADLVGYWLFLYGLCITAAAAIAIFRVSHWYDIFQTMSKQGKDASQNGNSP